MDMQELNSILEAAGLVGVPESKLNVRSPGQPDPQVFLRVGDVLRHECLGVVDMVNECRARVQPVGSRTREFTPRFGEGPVRISTKFPVFNVSTMTSASRVLARLGRDWKSYFPQGHRPPAAPTGEEQHQDTGGQQETDETMAKNAKTKKAAAAAEPSEKPTTKGPLGSYKGHSICSVLKRLGMAGVKAAEAVEIAKAQGWTCKPTTVALNISFGAKGDGAIAQLSQAEVAELRASAPKEAPAPAAPAPVSKKEAKPKKAKAAPAPAPAAAPAAA